MVETARRYDFRYGTILANAPRESGIYALFLDEQLLYIGDADNMLVGLMDRLDRPDLIAPGVVPTSFAFETCIPEHRRVRLFGLIFKHNPTYVDYPELKLRED
jgi:hypothetical protein